MKWEEIVFIKCPYCGEKILMDWYCPCCRKKIAYDISKEGIRSNPHKEENNDVS